MTSRHPAVSCACPKCQSERRTTPTPATDAREAVARAICLAHGAFPERRILAFYAHADAALSALAPIRSAEILAARTSGRNDATKAYLEGVEHGEAAAEANVTARIVAWLRATSTGLDLTKRRIADAIERNEHRSAK